METQNPSNSTEVTFSNSNIVDPAQDNKYVLWKREKNRSFPGSVVCTIKSNALEQQESKKALIRFKIDSIERYNKPLVKIYAKENYYCLLGSYYKSGTQDPIINIPKTPGDSNTKFGSIMIQKEMKLDF